MDHSTAVGTLRRCRCRDGMRSSVRASEVSNSLRLGLIIRSNFRHCSNRKKHRGFRASSRHDLRTFGKSGVKKLTEF